jgi:hypothetical protein
MESRRITAVFDLISSEIQRITTINHYNTYDMDKSTTVFDSISSEMNHREQSLQYLCAGNNHRVVFDSISSEMNHREQSLQCLWTGNNHRVVINSISSEIQRII